MSEIITSQVAFAKNEIKTITGNTIPDDRAFSHMLLKFIFDVDYIDQIDLVTDGANDGGIDFLYYDEEQAKVVLCQSKYTGDLSFEQVITELNKMYSTWVNFKRANTGSYNDRLKKALQNAIDQLPDDNSDNVEFNLFTTAPLDVNQAERKIKSAQHEFPIDAIRIFTEDLIEKDIQSVQEALQTVTYEKIKIDRPKNFLQYESDKSEGIMCNVLSTSLVQLYNKYAGAGLFDLNIRRYIRNTLVDTGIKKTLDSDRSNFWFFNNGIIIACKDYLVSGDTITLEDFSIVNGGQTTTLIGTYKGSNTQEFYLPCKIVKAKNQNEAPSFFTKMAEASNSQKPIFARDLKSNAPEMVRLGNWLAQENVYLEIKRGFKPTGSFKYKLKNDELAQIIMSFALQKPGTSRSGKRTIFENQNLYDQLFKVNYDNDPQKKGFVLDLIDLYARYSVIEAKLKTGGLNADQIEILKNGKQTIFAILGACYRIINNDVSKDDLVSSPKSLGSIPFVYGRFISKYTSDDLDHKLENAVKDIVTMVTDAYLMAYQNKATTSVSNFMKTDLKYYNDIASKFLQYYDLLIGQDLQQNIDFLKR